MSHAMPRVVLFKRHIKPPGFCRRNACFGGDRLVRQLNYTKDVSRNLIIGAVVAAWLSPFVFLRLELSNDACFIALYWRAVVAGVEHCALGG
ncbi:hypothetical protein HCH_02570 [Hahella chejuensis KCTC 2396]|uniref:Uncharacterized protein n=1 Tax=Hahella chejuensis (strain KCTC 2396) TaxID=349521 RepID=Q2SJ04_HAHCH|nr:hypothetical protein HCH_02570 [Hahella chejuensis KCTC 2396]